MTELELLREHREAMFCSDEWGRLLTINEPWDRSRPAPLLFLGRTISGDFLWNTRDDLPERLRDAVHRLASSGETGAEAYRKLLRADSFIMEICFRLPAPPPPGNLPLGCLEVTGENCRSLDLGEFGWLTEELPAASPCYAYFVNGRAVSVCRSVRIARAHEAGVETGSAFRGRGFAQIVLEAWAGAVAARGGLPLYSALQTNLPSLRLAEKSGFLPFGSGCSIG